MTHIVRLFCFIFQISSNVGSTAGAGTKGARKTANTVIVTVTSVVIVMKCVAAMSTASRISVLLFGVAVAVFMVNRNIVNKNRKVRNCTKSVLIIIVIFG